MPNQSYHQGDLKAELIQMGLKLLDQTGYENRDIPFEGDYSKLVSGIMDSDKFLW